MPWDIVSLRVSMGYGTLGLDIVTSHHSILRWPSMLLELHTTLCLWKNCQGTPPLTNLSNGIYLPQHSGHILSSQLCIYPPTLLVTPPSPKQLCPHLHPITNSQKQKCTPSYSVLKSVRDCLMQQMICH